MSTTVDIYILVFTGIKYRLLLIPPSTMEYCALRVCDSVVIVRCAAFISCVCYAVFIAHMLCYIYNVYVITNCVQFVLQWRQKVGARAPQQGQSPSKITFE